MRMLGEFVVSMGLVLGDSRGLYLVMRLRPTPVTSISMRSNASDSRQKMLVSRMRTTTRCLYNVLYCQINHWTLKEVYLFTPIFRTVSSCTQTSKGCNAFTRCGRSPISNE